MKKNILTNSTLFLIGALLAISASYASASLWKTAPTNPPEGNPPAPIYSDHPDQVKTGALAVNIFNAKQQAWFKKEFFSQGYIAGAPIAAIVSPPITSTLFIGREGTPDIAVDVSLAGTAKVYSGSIYGENIETQSGLREICAEKDGTIVLCEEETTTTPPPTIYDVYGQGPVEFRNQMPGGPVVFIASLCLSDTQTQDEDFVIRWGAIYSGIPSSGTVVRDSVTVTVLAGDTCSNEVDRLALGQSATTNATIVEYCVEPVNASLSVDPSLKC